MVFPVTSASAVGDSAATAAADDAATGRLHGVALDVPPLGESVCLEVTVPADRYRVITAVQFAGTGWGSAVLDADSERIAVLRVNHCQPGASLAAPYRLTGGRVLRCTVKNETIVSATNDYELIIFFREGLQ